MLVNENPDRKKKRFNLSIWFDHNKNYGGIKLYVKEYIPVKLLSRDFHSMEGFFVEIIFSIKKWLINCSYNPHKSNIRNHLDIISRSLDKHSTTYDNIVILGDFNAWVHDKALESFCKTYSSLIK